MTFTTWRRAAVVGIGLLALPMPVRADLEIASEVQIRNNTAKPNSETTEPPTPVVRTFTTQYKGLRARLSETGKDTVIIYDREAKKVYTLDTAKKTYFVRSYAEAMDPNQTLNEQLRSRFSVDTTLHLDVKKADKSAATDNPQIAGKNVEITDFSATATLTPNTSTASGASAGHGGAGGAGGAGGGRRHGSASGGFPGGSGGGYPGGSSSGGGFPSGGGQRSGGGARPQGGGIVRVTVTGEVWTTEADTLLPSGKKDQKDMLLPLAEQMFPDNDPLRAETVKGLSKTNRLPLTSHLTLTLPQRSQANGGDASSESPSLNTTPPTIDVDMKVTSLRTDAAFEDALFVVPSDYHLVDAPALVSLLSSPRTR